MPIRERKCAALPKYYVTGGHHAEETHQSTRHTDKIRKIGFKQSRRESFFSLQIYENEG